MECLKNFAILGNSWRRCSIETKEYAKKEEDIARRGEGHLQGDTQGSDLKTAAMHQVWGVISLGWSGEKTSQETSPG